MNLVERIPPEAVEVERAILGACLIDKKAVEIATESIQDEDFYKPAHRKIYQAIVSLAERDEVVDQVTVFEELKRRNLLDEVGGPLYVAKLAAQVATSGNVQAHIQIVQGKSMRRRLIECGTRIVEDGFDESTTAEEAKAQTEQRLLALTNGKPSGVFVASKDALQEAFEGLSERQQAGGGITGVTSGFVDLDRMTLGFQQSDLILIAARPSMGKSAIALNIARHAAKSGVPVAIFSLEMSQRLLGQRLVASEARIDTMKVRSGVLDSADWNRLASWTGKLSELPIYINDTGGITVSDIRSNARHARRKYGIGLVIVDYLQLITTRKSYENKNQQITYISGQLKAMAKELDVPVIALSQLSRAVEMRGGDHKPMLSDLRDSGSLEQDADVILFIHRPEMYGMKENTAGDSLAGVAEIIIAKQRNGPTGSVYLTWVKEYTRFENAEYEHSEVSY